MKVSADVLHLQKPHFSNALQGHEARDDTGKITAAAHHWLQMSKA